MTDLPTVDRQKTPGEQPSDEAGEFLPLTVRELIPQEGDRCGRGGRAHRRGGTVGSFRLRMIDLLEVDRDVDTTGTVPAVP
jgi:hypothetical protein